MIIHLEQLHKVYSDGEIDVDPIEFEKWLKGKPPSIPELSYYISKEVQPIVDFEGDIHILGIETSARDLYGYEELFEEVKAIQKARDME